MIRAAAALVLLAACAPLADAPHTQIVPARFDRADVIVRGWVTTGEGGIGRFDMIWVDAVYQGAPTPLPVIDRPLPEVHGEAIFLLANDGRFFRVIDVLDLAAEPEVIARARPVSAEAWRAGVADLAGYVRTRSTFQLFEQLPMIGVSRGELERVLGAPTARTADTWLYTARYRGGYGVQVHTLRLLFREDRVVRAELVSREAPR